VAAGRWQPPAAVVGVTAGHPSGRETAAAVFSSKEPCAMLAISRRHEEAVVLRLGEVTVRITVLSAQAGRVRLGFEAPREVVITRSELLERPLKNEEVKP
jgi:carbon storage regulator CsrA